MPSDTVAPHSTGRAPAVGALGLFLPTFPQQGSLLTAAELAAVCRGAEDAGASALWACDHLYWHSPVLECLTSVGVAVASTTQAMVGPCVLQLPLRHPAAVAKQVSSLQHLSGGRVVLGVGVGSHADEYAAAGVDFAGRGRRLDDAIDELRGAWTDDAAVSGPDGYRQLPVGDPVPVWVGGSSEAALRRAATRADGWIPLFMGPEDYAAAMSRLDKEAERAGRDAAEIDRAVVVFVSVGDHDAEERGLAWMSSLYRLPPRAFAHHLVHGLARGCADAVARYFEAGATHLAIFVTDDDPLVQFEHLAGELTGRCPEAGRQAATPPRARTPRRAPAQPEGVAVVETRSP